MKLTHFLIVILITEFINLFTHIDILIPEFINLFTPIDILIPEFVQIVHSIIDEFWLN